jgi:hypothetical protein
MDGAIDFNLDLMNDEETSRDWNVTNTRISSNEFCVPSFVVCVRQLRFLQHVPSLTTLSSDLRKAYTNFVTSATD